MIRSFAVAADVALALAAAARQRSSLSELDTAPTSPSEAR